MLNNSVLVSIHISLHVTNRSIQDVYFLTKQICIILGIKCHLAAHFAAKAQQQRVKSEELLKWTRPICFRQENTVLAHMLNNQEHTMVVNNEVQ